VLGGGGITPDIGIPARELNRFEALLSSRDIFFEYARRVTSGQVPAASNLRLPVKTEEVGSRTSTAPSQIPNFEISDAILEDFRQYLRTRGVEFTESDISGNLDFIRRGIKQQVYTSSFGLQEGFKIAVQGDVQVKKALEVLPEAEVLMSTGQRSPVARNPEIK